jgi:protein-tyrosine phosphatase
MIDIHTHILPGIDDGVQTEEEAIAFARMAVEDGITRMVATPHCKESSYDNDLPLVLEKVAALRTTLKRLQIPLELIPGAEVHICPDLVERIRDGRAPTLANNGKTLLLELSLTQPPPVELENLVFQLKLAGILPVFAHPERIQYFQDDVRRYEEMIRLGAWGQITTGSVLGTFGSAARRFSEKLIRKGLIHVLASDAHNVRGRPPRLREAALVIEDWIGRVEAQRMVTSTPECLLAGMDPKIPAFEPVRRTVRKRSFLSRIFGSS